MSKKPVRKAMRTYLREMTPQMRTILSNVICQRVISSTEYQEAKTIAAYASLPDEVDTDLILHNALFNEKKLLMPRVDPETGKMSFFSVSDVEADLREGPPFGIREPILERCEGVSLCEADLIIIPGLAFDRSGNRLGRGKGFYDSVLCNATDEQTKAALAFQRQVVRELPIDSHDIPVDMVITDRYTYTFRKCEIVCETPEDTEELGFKLGEVIPKDKLVTLIAPLGCGKTVLVKGMLRARGGKCPATSPTYTLVNEYKAKKSSFHHVDLFRWDWAKATEENCAEMLDILSRDGLIAVEWADRLPELIPMDAVLIEGSHNDGARTWTVMTFVQEDIEWIGKV